MHFGLIVVVELYGKNDNFYFGKEDIEFSGFGKNERDDLASNIR
jgi:hypothetical protein